MSAFATLLTPSQVERIHDASLEILESIGLLARNDRAKEILKKHGCDLDAETEIVKFPRGIVEECIRCCPPKFTFSAREPSYDRTLPDDRPVIMTASSAPNMLDPITGKERRAYSDDIANVARVVDELAGYDCFSVATLAEDAPLDRFTVTRVYPALKNCRKPVRCSTSSEVDAAQLVQLGYAIAGSEAAYRERPFITHHYCPIVSPLTFDLDSTSELIYYCEQDLPSYATIVPNGGMSSPYTLLGTLAQTNAEFLAYATLTQLIRPGKSLIYSTLPTMADLRRGNYSPGSIENGMLVMGAVQMAKFYNVPSAGYVGLTNAKVNDAQCGYEAGIGNVAALLAGCDLFSMGGLLDALMCFDYGKLVIDAEIGLMLKRIQRGYEFGDEMMSLDVIAETGPAGMFIDKPQTYELMKTTMLIPDIADRDPRQRWEKLGALDANAHARRKVQEILTHNHASLISPDEEARVRAVFADLPSGECKPPREWSKIA
jgi:trimethylamine--corrinoid protein Co-methyltransferase